MKIGIYPLSKPRTATLTIDHLANWDGQSAPYVTNDDGALTWATTEYFKLPNS